MKLPAPGASGAGACGGNMCSADFDATMHCCVYIVCCCDGACNSASAGTALNGPGNAR